MDEDEQEVWVIETWMGRHVFVGKEFDSFEEARDYISDYAYNQVEGLPEDEADEEYGGICEDLYAVVKGDKHA